jgi:nucleotide-binding universal stress UspA family protein
MSAAPVLLESIAQQEEEWAALARKRFEDAVQAANIQSSFEHGLGPRFTALSTHARYSDLLVLTQDSDDGQPRMSGFADNVLLDCARPVLMVPYVGAAVPIGGTAVVAWNGTRESTRAVNDALPLLSLAKQVQVVVIEPDDTPLRNAPLPGADISAHLARHGLNVEAKVLHGSGISAGNLLLSHAADVSANLIVMGAYGHSRLREMILGGVTHQLLQEMTVPVLMSH